MSTPIAVASDADAVFRRAHAAWAVEVAARNAALTWGGDTEQDREWFQTANVNRRRHVARILPEPTRSHPRLSASRIRWSAMRRHFLSAGMQRRAALLTHLNRWIKQMRHAKLMSMPPPSSNPAAAATAAGSKSKAKPKAAPVDRATQAASRKRKAEADLNQRATLVQMVKDPRLLKRLFPSRQSDLDSFFATPTPRR